LSPSQAEACAAAIVAAFARYNTEYRAITRRAPERFENRDWSGSQSDVVERLELYSSMVNESVAGMRQQLGEHALDPRLWVSIRGLRLIVEPGRPEPKAQKPCGVGFWEVLKIMRTE
jgi:isocitrate dehydrogenase kinase/phosphatase